MSNKQPTNPSAVAPCPAGDDHCTNLSEVVRLQEEVKQLAALVRTDELTRLFNFRYFNQALSLEMERTRRSGQPTCLIMLDLDHFKSINDAYGHEVGNIVLSHIANLIRKTIRRLDIPCRYGGEEFTIILPDTTLKQGARFANRLRLIIENSPVKASDVLLGIEASFGVDIYCQGSQQTEKEFVEKVDSFLYLAKQEGRNRVCHVGFDKANDATDTEKKKKS
ncbi:MAG: GGDEF domain-containing protein [SAR86 cluster bacterium]|uniref:diguanylate cyclase n=1 Tax=SAR86 cluster bacterium TaxID=2030880 RepID=A0A2A5B0G9_9GAMM|nr:MAG: GGDEF domain-containing protein [SAR86 cluster bacterium]